MKESRLLLIETTNEIVRRALALFMQRGYAHRVKIDERSYDGAVVVFSFFKDVSPIEYQIEMFVPSVNGVPRLPISLSLSVPVLEHIPRIPRVDLSIHLNWEGKEEDLAGFIGQVEAKIEALVSSKVSLDDIYNMWLNEGSVIAAGYIQRLDESVAFVPVFRNHHTGKQLILQGNSLISEEGTAYRINTLLDFANALMTIGLGK